ncbi:MAG TPA: hypothetical protein VMT38_11250 [Terracidiphilus sp.]|nr:hypothetical protein [Terracidiphilus sp.]
MRKFIEATRSFWTGWANIPEYFAAVKDHAWETLWGAGVIGILFGILTIYWAPSRSALGYVIALVVFIAGYYVWRPQYLKLTPKFEITSYTIQRTDTFDRVTGLKNGWSNYFQLLPKCLTDANVENCRGFLTSVEMHDGFKNCWETVESETMFLQWSHGDDSTEPAPITLYPRAERRLNVFYLPNDNPEIRMCVFPYPVRFFTLFNQLALRKILEIRLNIRLVAENCLPVDVIMMLTPTADPRRPKVDLAVCPIAGLSDMRGLQP